jgi:hypothetical protein
MWLREYCRAFHHVSRNLKRAEKEAAKYGTVVDVGHIGNIAVFPKLEQCPYERCNGAPVLPFGENQKCTKCLTTFPGIGLFNRIEEAKSEAVWLPKPVEDKIERAKKYLPPNAVGVFIDTANLYHSAKNLYKRKVNFGAVLKDAVAGRKLVRATAYAKISSGLATEIERDFTFTSLLFICVEYI